MINYKIIDITNKKKSYRRACVLGSIYVGKDVFYRIKYNNVEKGNPLSLAKIAGIYAAKNTSKIILLCHNINIESVFINIMMDDINYIINVYCIVSAYSKTGVEMEAMLGVSTALLTIYDLTKKFNPFIIIKNIKLLFKSGGENGLIIGSLISIPYYLRKHFYNNFISFNKINVIVITISDRSSFNFYNDISGVFLFDFFYIKNALVSKIFIIPDDFYFLLKFFKKCINKYLPNIIISTGGTGVSCRDTTYQVLNKLSKKKLIGIPELLRSYCSKYSKNSWLSNSFCGIYNKSAIISLPGNCVSIYESLNILENVLLHIINNLKKDYD